MVVGDRDNTTVEVVLRRMKIDCYLQDQEAIGANAKAR